MVDCNCKWKLVDPSRHEAQCDVVLTARLRQKERSLSQLEQLVPFPGLQAFHDASKFDLRREIANLNKRLNKQTTTKRSKR